MDNNANPNKKSKIGLIVLLVIIILGLGGYVVYDKVLSTGNQNKGNNSKDDKSNSIKIEDSKEYVYDAEYKYDNKYAEYERGFTDGSEEKRTIDLYGIPVEFTYNTQRLEDLKVPYININSYDAGNANGELKELYMKVAKNFDSCAFEAESDSAPSCSQILTYRTYQYNNILSVVVIDSIQATSKWVLNYNIYNFDLKTGDKIDYNEMLSKLRLEKNVTFDALKQDAKNEMDEFVSKTNFSEELSKACHYGNDENGNSKYGTDNCYEITYQLLQKSIDENKILFFVDNDGNLNVMAILYFDFVQNGDVDYYLLKVSK